MPERIKVIAVFGTRPEAIKMAPVIQELYHARAAFETMVIATGQHREMLDQMLTIFKLVPDYHLNLRKKMVPKRWCLALVGTVW